MIAELPPRTLVYSLLTAATNPDGALSAEHEAWLRAMAPLCPFNPQEPLALRHPLYSHLIGFACGILRRHHQHLRVEEVQVMVGNERRCLDAVKANFTPADFKVHYSPCSWAPKYLWARMLAWSVRSGLSMAAITNQEIALAEIVSLSGLVGAPPLHLAAEALGAGAMPRPLPDIAVRKLLESGEHGLLCRQLLFEVWATAAVYGRMYFGPTARVLPLEIPAGLDSAWGAGGNP